MTTMWPEPSLHDVGTLTDTRACQRVALRRRVIGGVESVVPVIETDVQLWFLALLLLSRDVIGRLEATSGWDHRPRLWRSINVVYSRQLCYGVTLPNAGYDIEGAIALLESDQRALVPTFALAENPSPINSFLLCARSPRMPDGVVTKRPRIPYTTSATTKATAERIAAFFWSQNEADEAIDAELAAEVAATYTATRATLLENTERIFGTGIWT